MSPRKRRKSQAFPEADNEDATSVVAEEQQDHLEKEREIWDAFREEHFEVIEQLPLSLHRQYALINELEQQSVSYTADLLSTLKRYITKRREITPKIYSTPSLAATIVEGNGSTAQFDRSDTGGQAQEEIPTVIAPLPVNGTTSKSGASLKQQPPTIPRPHMSLGVSPERARTLQTTRQMLSHVGHLTEELLRASDEKVNLAQAAYESVNRHACILEQAIKEQEASISSGARPGHLAVLTLPELVPPRWAQTAPATPTHDDETELMLGDEKPEDLDVGKSSEPPLEVKGRRRGFRGKRGKAAVPGGHFDGQGMSLTITLPGQAITGEETFCRCEGVSFGDMVGCDNDKCEGQWFHLSCVGLAELPTEGIWYCSPECRAMAETKTTATTTRKRKRK